MRGSIAEPLGIVSPANKLNFGNKQQWTWPVALEVFVIPWDSLGRTSEEDAAPDSGIVCSVDSPGSVPRQLPCLFCSLIFSQLL